MSLMKAMNPTVISDATSDAAGVVFGIVDGHWRIGQISIDAGDLLGVPNSQLLGSSLLEYAHHGDRQALINLPETVIVDGVGVTTTTCLGRPGRWVEVQMVLAPMAQRSEELGFVITRSNSIHNDPRAARLEQHLRRIAQELEAAGLDVRTDAGLDVTLLPGSEELSPRQWEVLRRLLRGERVPGIARDLFISASTVRNHLTAIFAKVGVHSQEELLARLRATPATWAS